MFIVINQNFIIKYLNIYIIFTYKCDFRWKPPKTKHCSVTNKCIKNYNHYSYFYSKCINNTNHL